MIKVNRAKWLLAVLFAIYLPQATAELEARIFSPSVVLVLNLVSKTRVQPITGIVVSNDGLVLVPAEFVTADSEIIVLDGGTDIIKNGRPAVALDRPAVNGWAVLSVAGLERPGITLSDKNPIPGAELQLMAFPPAEYIANGLPPLWAGIVIEQVGPGDFYHISPETPPPYVTGPILDDCGYLTGVSLTTGLQSLDTSAMPKTLFAGDLRRTLSSLQLDLPSALCQISQREQQQTPVDTKQSGKERTKKQAEQIDPNLLRPETYSPLIKTKRLNPFQGAKPRPQPVEKPSLWRLIPIWLWVLGLLIISVIIWKVYFFFRVQKKPADLPAAKEQERESSTYDTKPEFMREAPSQQEQMPDLDALPADCNGVLIVECIADQDFRIKRYFPVSTVSIDISIGRTGSDIDIPHASISPKHARFMKHGESMTLSDLGSVSGTFIKAVPCLKGEIMYLESADSVYLGGVQLFFNILHKEIDPS